MVKCKEIVSITMISGYNCHGILTKDIDEQLSI